MSVMYIFSCEVLDMQGRLPFQVPDKVQWPHLAEALVTKFASNCGLGLSIENLSYLAFKLFGLAEGYNMHTVSWAQFNRVCFLASATNSKQ